MNDKLFLGDCFKDTVKLNDLKRYSEESGYNLNQVAKDLLLRGYHVPSKSLFALRKTKRCKYI